MLGHLHPGRGGVPDRGAGGRVTLVYLDLDDFKPINDEYGHETGDRLLGAVAGRLRACVRTQDLVARLGGDEFAVLLDGASQEEVEGVVRRIGSVLDTPVGIGGLRVPSGSARARPPTQRTPRTPTGCCAGRTRRCSRRSVAGAAPRPARPR